MTGRVEINSGGEKDSCKPVLLPKKIDGGPHPKALQHPMVAPQQDDAKALRAKQEATNSWLTVMVGRSWRCCTAEQQCVSQGCSECTLSICILGNGQSSKHSLKEKITAALPPTFHVPYWVGHQFGKRQA